MENSKVLILQGFSKKQAVKYLWKSERVFIPLFFEIIDKAKALQKTGENPFQKQIDIWEKITACEKAGCGNGGKKKKRIIKERFSTRGKEPKQRN